MSTAYIQTVAGIYREVDGEICGPFTSEDLGLPPGTYVPECQTLRGVFSEPASLSFGFGHGLARDNRFEK